MHVPALLGQRLHDDRVALVGADAELAALQVAERDLGEVGEPAGSSPVRATSGARRLVGALQGGDEDRREVLAAQARADPSACSRPVVESGGLPRPSSISCCSPSTASADAPWRTSTISVARGGTAYWRCA